jgi:hypothetical protein
MKRRWRWEGASFCNFYAVGSVEGWHLQQRWPVLLDARLDPAYGAGGYAYARYRAAKRECGATKIR